MNVTKKALENHDEIFNGVKYAPAGENRPMDETNPEYVETFLNFAFDEVYEHGNYDKKLRWMIILASMIAQNTRDRYKVFLAGALNIGITPEEIMEIVYQAVPYCGIARVFDIIYDTNEVLEANGVKLPVTGGKRISNEDRFKEGLKVQKEIFGDENIENMRNSAPNDEKHIQDYLSANCFGDYYTRGYLDLKTREILTFAMLISLGGCEPQVKGHIGGNLNVGNTREFLIETVTQLLPYIGYPRSLNALRCIDEVCK